MIGDSHAASLSSTIRQYIEAENGNLVSMTKTGCLPLPHTQRYEVKDRSCDEFKTIAFNVAKAEKATVIISARWRLNFVGPRFVNQEGGTESGVNGLTYVVGDQDQNIFDYARQKLSALAETNRVVIISQIPEAGWNVPRHMWLKGRFGKTSTPLSTSYDVYKTQNKEVLSLMSDLSLHQNISIIKAEDIICDNKSGRCLNELENNVSLYADDDHPSLTYADLITMKIMRMMNDL